MESNPELPSFGVECQNCGELIEINDNSTILFLDEENQLWAYIKCSLPYDCDAMTLEVGPEDTAYYAHLTSYYDQNGNEMEVIEVSDKEATEAAAKELVNRLLLKNWGPFWGIYKPEAWEFGSLGHL